MDHVKPVKPLYEILDSFFRDHRAKKKFISGRQLLSLMGQFFATDEAAGGTYDIEDFFVVTLSGKSLEI